MNKDEFINHDLKKFWTFIKKNAWIILVCTVFGYLGGAAKTEIDLELDCKYAKATRIGGSAFKCERII